MLRILLPSRRRRQRRRCCRHRFAAAAAAAVCRGLSHGARAAASRASMARTRQMCVFAMPELAMLWAARRSTWQAGRPQPRAGGRNGAEAERGRAGGAGRDSESTGKCS